MQPEEQLHGYYVLFNVSFAVVIPRIKVVSAEGLDEGSEAQRIGFKAHGLKSTEHKFIV